ncbi:unnamed protein product [Arabidopsis lyrata]|uniref:Predicted protein n=1 Tax=Arabidopsis lyrata subsp. lyrata TaxID=81972 RepID=D7LTS8_ARALL|nr:predicted protein [Arabidopsis lyrata subsp. lyrata]CAH8268234.1 unnamed protein product [Arabidopsis lyrata]
MPSSVLITCGQVHVNIHSFQPIIKNHHWIYFCSRPKMSFVGPYKHLAHFFETLETPIMVLS